MSEEFKIPKGLTDQQAKLLVDILKEMTEVANRLEAHAYRHAQVEVLLHETIEFLKQNHQPDDIASFLFRYHELTKEE